MHTPYHVDIDKESAALEEEIPITDPAFYSSEILCPDSLIEHIFRPADQCNDAIPLLKERIAIMREVGLILCNVCVSFVWWFMNIINTGLISRASRGHSRLSFKNFIGSTGVKEQLSNS